MTTSDPTKPLCVFEKHGQICGMQEQFIAHAVHGKGFCGSMDCHPYTPPAETGRKNVGKYSMGYCCDGGSNGEKHSQDCRYNAAPVSPEPPRCPKCGEIATWRDASGTFWDSNAHYWRLQVESSAGTILGHAMQYLNDQTPKNWDAVETLNKAWAGYMLEESKRRRGAGTVGATPEPESKADQQWLHLVAKLNTIHAQLQHKPSHLKCGHRQEIGSILNAYREGDLSFDEAKLAAQSLPSPAPQARICGNCGLPLAESETEEQCREIFGSSSPAQPVGTTKKEQADAE